jgi:hypothetical protein
MTSLALVAARATREATLDALARATSTKETVPPEPVGSEELMHVRLDHWLNRLVKERIDAFVLGVSSGNEWTMLADVQMVLPAEIDILRTMSSDLHSVVAAMIFQTLSSTFGLVVCDRGALKRNFMSVEGEIHENSGALDLENPTLPVDPWDGVKNAWERIVTSGPCGGYEVRVLSTEPISAAAPAPQEKPPWWKLW